jgi:hypothetical protein
MDIGRTEGVGGAGRIEGLGRVSKPASSTPASAAGGADRVELSGASQLIGEALSLPSVRTERIDEVRQLMASGELDSDARLEGALDRFLAENRDLIQG